MVCNAIGYPEFLSVDTLLEEDSNIIHRLLSILNIPYCTHNNKIYHLDRTLDSNKINLKMVQCNCENLVFMLNLIYYIDIYNECMLLNGKINNFVLSLQEEKIKFTMITQGNLTNLNLNENQSQMASVNMINLRDPKYIDAMSSEYTTLIKKLSYNYLKKYKMKPPFKDSNLYNFFLDNAEASTMNPTVYQSVESVNGLMTLNSQYINFMIVDSIFQSLTVNINQTNKEKIIVNNVSDNIFKKFLDDIFDIEKKIILCSSLKLNPNNNITNIKPTNDIQKTPEKIQLHSKKNFFLIYAIYFTLALLLFTTIYILLEE